jgi:hypothetical protein
VEEAIAFKKNLMKYKGHAVPQWLRHCATNRKVAGSIPDGVIGLDLGSSQSLTE